MGLNYFKSFWKAGILSYISICPPLVIILTAAVSVAYQF